MLSYWINSWYLFNVITYLGHSLFTDIKPLLSSHFSLVCFQLRLDLAFCSTCKYTNMIWTRVTLSHLISKELPGLHFM